MLLKNDTIIIISYKLLSVPFIILKIALFIYKLTVQYHDTNFSYFQKCRLLKKCRQIKHNFQKKYLKIQL